MATKLDLPGCCLNQQLVILVIQIRMKVVNCIPIISLIQPQVLTRHGSASW